MQLSPDVSFRTVYSRVTRGRLTVLFDLQPSAEPIVLDEELPGQSFPAVDTIAAVVAPVVSDGVVEAHDFVHEVAEELGLARYLG
jgi:hypothetical protein